MLWRWLCFRETSSECFLFFLCLGLPFGNREEPEAEAGQGGGAGRDRAVPPAAGEGVQGQGGSGGFFLHHSTYFHFTLSWGSLALAAPSGWSQLQQEHFLKCLPVRHSHVSWKNPWKWLRMWCGASQLAGEDLRKLLSALRGDSLPKAAVCSSVQKRLSSLLLSQAYFHGADMAESTCRVPGHQKGRLRF